MNEKHAPANGDKDYVVLPPKEAAIVPANGDPKDGKLWKDHISNESGKKK
jgi:hypothetical protein